MSMTAHNPGEIPVPPLPVKAVAEQELVTDLEPPVFDGHVDDPARHLVEQCNRLQARRAPHLQVPTQRAERQTGVDDVLDDEDMTVLERDRRVHRQERHGLARQIASIAGSRLRGRCRGS